MNMLRTFIVPVLAISCGLVVANSPAATAAEALGPTLTTPATPSRLTGSDGFIPRWALLEPIPVMGLTQNLVQAMVKKEYFPGQSTVIPHNGDTVTVDGKTLTWHAAETKLYNVNLYHFGNALKKPTTNALFWVVTVVNSPAEMHNVRLAIGSNSASVWWVNSEEVIGIYGDRQTVIDDGVSKRITLKKGPNVLRAAVVNGGGATDFCARFLDASDKPIKGLTITLNEGR